MILIGSKDITKEELPNHEMMEYHIDWGKGLDVKLKTMATSPKCFRVLLDERLKGEVTVLGIIYDKVEYFADNMELRRKLQPEGCTEIEEEVEKELDSKLDSEPDIFDDSKDEKPTVVVELEGESDTEKKTSEIKKDEDTSDIFTKKPQVEESEKAEEEEEDINVETKNIDSQKGTEVQLEVGEVEDVEEVDTEISSELFKIPNIDEDIDSYKLIVKHKDEVIKQKEAMLKELETQLEEIHLVQDEQVEGIKEMYMSKVEEANEKISLLEERLEKVKKGEETGLGKYMKYVKNYKTPLKDSIVDEGIGKLNSNYKIFASGTGDSFYSMMKQVKKYIEKNPKAIVIDFTGDYYLNTSYGMKKVLYNCIDLTREGVDDLDDVFKSINKTKLAFTTLYNDISLLGVDWVHTLNKIDSYAGGLPVVLIFNSITSFSVRYTVSKLLGVMDLHLFVKSSPLILSAMYNDILFIPTEGVEFVVMDYIDVVKPIVDLLSNKYKVTAFTGDVEWKKLGLK